VSTTQFFQTLMGRKFFEADVPRLVRAVERIADALEQLSQQPKQNEKKED